MNQFTLSELQDLWTALNGFIDEHRHIQSPEFDSLLHKIEDMILTHNLLIVCNDILGSCGITLGMSPRDTE